MKSSALWLTLPMLLLSIAATAAFAENTGRAPDGTPAAAPLAPVSGNCLGMTVISYKSDDTINKSTSSSNFVDVPNSGVSFTQGGSGNGCVIVTFTAESFAPANRLLQIRARLDSSVTAVPGNVQLSGDDDTDFDGRWARSHTFTFVFPSVAPGARNVKMQFRSPAAFGNVYIHKHTVVVQHP